MRNIIAGYSKQVKTMGYSHLWLVPERIYIFQVYGELTMDDVSQGSEESIQYVRSGQPPVHSIIDIRNVTSYPKSVSQIRQAAAIMKEPNVGWIVGLSNDRVLSFIGDLVAQLSNVKSKTTFTPEEALDFLWRVDSTLPQVIPEYPSFPESE